MHYRHNPGILTGVSSSPGHRDRKKQRTRRTIERVALDLFEENGFDGTTIDQIATAADIAPRTFFHYFPSKEHVVLTDYTESPGSDRGGAHRQPARSSTLDGAAGSVHERGG